MHFDVCNVQGASLRVCQRILVRTRRKTDEVGQPLVYGNSNWYFLARFCLYPRLLIQLVRRFGKPVLCSSPAPCATWPALFWHGCFAPPPPHPTCSAVSRARFLSSPALCATWPIIFWYDFFASPAPHPTLSGQVKQICPPLTSPCFRTRQRL